MGPPSGPHAPTCPPPPCGEGLGVGGANTTIPSILLRILGRLRSWPGRAFAISLRSHPTPVPSPSRGGGPCLALLPAITAAYSRERRSMSRCCEKESPRGLLVERAEHGPLV